MNKKEIFICILQVIISISLLLIIFLVDKPLWLDIILTILIWVNALIGICRPRIIEIRKEKKDEEE